MTTHFFELSNKYIYTGQKTTEDGKPIILSTKANLEPSCYDKDADPLYGILIRIAELDLSGVPRHSSAEERYKMGQKMERQQRRRHSIMVANLTAAGYSQGGIKME